MKIIKPKHVRKSPVRLGLKIKHFIVKIYKPIFYSYLISCCPISDLVGKGDVNFANNKTQLLQELCMNQSILHTWGKAVSVHIPSSGLPLACESNRVFSLDAIFICICF